MSDEKKGFTVKDRRLFTPDGRRRDEGPAEQPEPPAERFETPPARRPGPPLHPEAPPGPQVDFAGFLLSLAGQAGAFLESESAADLDGARQIISILEMLKIKTEGRRTPDEDRVLEGLLYELRMSYVERARMAKA